MPTKEAAAPSSNIACPSCGAIFSIAGVGKRRRVQCPKCREVVSLEKKQPADVLENLREELAALRIEVERLHGVEKRVAILERALEVQVELPPEAAELPVQSVHLRWLSRQEAKEAQENDSLDPQREEILQHNLQQSPGKMIAIRSAVGDPIARQLAERFKAVFERSAWKVIGVDEVPVPMVEHGLALAGGSLPTPPDLATAYIAFTAAGYDLVPRLDPNLEPNDAVLIVA